LTIENLGAVSVVCLDKTGTITENKMQIKFLYDADHDQLQELNEKHNLQYPDVLRIARLASELDPFDAMEKAIVSAFDDNCDSMPSSPEMIYEYPLTGVPPM